MNMFFNMFNNMDGKIKKILKYGFRFSFLVSSFAIILLLFDNVLNYPDLYYISFSIFKLGLFFLVEFIVCAIAVDTIKHQIT